MEKREKKRRDEEMPDKLVPLRDLNDVDVWNSHDWVICIFLCTSTSCFRSCCFPPDNIQEMPGKRRANQMPADYEASFNAPDYERLRLSPVVDDSSVSSEFDLYRDYSAAIPPPENIPPQEEKKSRGAMRTLEENSAQLDHMLETVLWLQEQPEAMNELDAELANLQTKIGTLAQKLVKMSEKIGQRACFHEPAAPTP